MFGGGGKFDLLRWYLKQTHIKVKWNKIQNHLGQSNIYEVRMTWLYCFCRGMRSQVYLTISFEYLLLSVSTYSSIIGLGNLSLWLKWSQICSVYRNHNPVLSSSVIYHRVINKSKTTAVTSAAGTYYPDETLKFILGF